MTKSLLNPRREIEFIDEGGCLWNLQYIYYNDKYHGKPANKCHDEFRLTCIMTYIREHNIKSGDQIWFAITDTGERHIGYVRAGEEIIQHQEEDDEDMVIIKIKSWTSIKK